MKIFISWSGDRSKKIAELFNTWLPLVIQSSDPWMSTEIDRGAKWFTEIEKKLAETNIGIVCLTSENLNNPWILFESGALAKGLEKSRVCTFLTDIEPSEVQPPLSMFNHTFNNETVHGLLETINKSQEKPLNQDTLKKSFKTYWPEFEKKWEEIRKLPTNSKTEKRSIEDMLKEVLEIVRGLRPENPLNSRVMDYYRFFIDKSSPENILKSALDITNQTNQKTELIRQAKEMKKEKIPFKDMYDQLKNTYLLFSEFTILEILKDNDLLY